MDETPEMNNHAEKPIHGKMEINASNMGSSENPIQKEQIEISNAQFDFLQSNDISVAFNYNGAEIENIYLDLKNSCKYVICILAKDDTYFSSDLLKKTLNAIKYNLPGINKLIEPENILICIFFNEINNDSIFKEEEKYLLNYKLQYLLSRKIFSIDSDTINIHCFCKIDYFTEVEILKLFYIFISS